MGMPSDFWFALPFAVVGGGAILVLSYLPHAAEPLSERRVFSVLGGTLAIVLILLVVTFVHPQRFERDWAYFEHGAR